MREIRYVLANENDIDGIYNIDKSNLDSYSMDQIRTHMCNEGNITLVAKSEEKVLGYILISTILDEAELIKIAVDKDYRCQKIASTLMSEAFNMLKKRGITKMFLEVRENNDPAITLYEKFNFVCYNVREKYYGNTSAKLYRVDI